MASLANAGLEDVGVTMRGWLMKKGGVVGWNDRWFELYGNILKIRKTPTDGEARSEFVINAGTTVADLETVPFGLQVIFDGNKALKLKAKTAPECSTWQRAFQNIIEIERRKRTISRSGFEFDIPAYYAVDNILGKGAYGCVVSAIDERNGAKVAIKKVGEAFADTEDAKRILREIRLMRNLRHHPNILRLTDLLKPSSLTTFEDVYICTEEMSMDLAKLLQMRSVRLSEDQQQWIMYQILCGIKYLHSASVLHRDLKPANILINIEDCTVKICDFGLSRTEGDELTDYVVTRWYRAPEVLMNNRQYGPPVDVFAVGCIFAEVLGRQVLFQGKNVVDQLTLIVRLVGTPEPGELETFVTDYEALKYVHRLEHSKGADFTQLFPQASPQSIDLLQQMLKINPSKRINDDAAILHPYLASVRVPEENESCASGPVAMADIEHLQLNKDDAKACLQKMIFQEILHFHADIEADESASGMSRLGMK